VAAKGEIRQDLFERGVLSQRELEEGRRVLADQMEYLLAHFPRTSLLHERLQRFKQ